MEADYNPQQVEAAAQAYWEDNQSFRVTEEPDREKFYCLSMFPYPSGKLHMGHVRNYTIGDVISRYQRMRGKHVLQPMGWDAFGLPAENAAISHATPPAEWTRSNIRYMKQQLKSLGFAYDWQRELATCDADYYRWEQWLFTRLVDKGLAYRKQAMVNWDPVDQTVLANEQVIDGRGWRSGAVVEKREVEQWFLRITDYAQSLLDDLDRLSDWPEQVVAMQRNWIGRSEGVTIEFAIEGSGEALTVFTTRPDTLMGVTYMAVAAEHPLALRAAGDNAEVAAFVEACRRGMVSEAELETMEKQGVALGVDAVHPVTGDAVPVYAANFVLMGYGTGAVMAVPAHDQRDWEFSQKYGIARRQVIVAADGAACGIDEAAYVEPGVLTNSGRFDGLSSAEAFSAIADYLAAAGKGGRQVNFRLRDWGVSRQRYWGCPIPMVKTRHGIEAATEFPVRLPEDVVVDGSGSPLKRMPGFYDLGEGGERETDTFDTFFESSWYYARYCCPDADEAMLDERARYWLPVDQYVGGVEHAILHLLYARFFNKLMRDEGLIDNDEPFTRLLTQGMVVAETWYRQHDDGSREWFNPADVDTERDARGRMVSATLRADGQPVIFGGIEKMSKSKNNGADPQSLIDRYGADTVRLYTMFTAPPEQSLEWSDEGVAGAARFIRRLWGFAREHAAELAGSSGRVPVPGAAQSEQYSRQFPPVPACSRIPVPGALQPEQRAIRREVHGCLRQALLDYERQQYNTVVSACMKILKVLPGLVSGVMEDKPGHPVSDSAIADSAMSDSAMGDLAVGNQERSQVMSEAFSIMLRLLAPIAPHVTHCLWRELGYGDDILDAPWPEVDEAALARDSIEMVVQVNGRVRGRIDVVADAGRAAIESAAMANENVQRFIDGQAVRKVIVVPKKLVNIVVS